MGEFKQMTPRVRTFGSMVVVEWIESGIARILVPPLQNGDPDTSERALAEWADMSAELLREGYPCVGRLEPDHSEQQPICHNKGAIILGTFMEFWVYKPFEHYSMSEYYMEESDNAWAT